MFDRLKGHTAHESIVLVVTPLASLMVDQKARFLPHGISAEFLGEVQFDAQALQRVREGQHSLVFLTPVVAGCSRNGGGSWHNTLQAFLH